MELSLVFWDGVHPTTQAHGRLSVAQKLAVILHRMWIEGSEFEWSSKEANQPA
jgi:phospholipase/lecithinase/hemolysin